MPQPKVMILRTAGTNCDEEAAFAWELAGAQTDRVHINALIEQPDRLQKFAILTIPGGFSYGDDIAAGKILARQLIQHLSDALRDFVAAGRLVLGICNGFQVLVKAGLLPGSSTEPEAQARAASRTEMTLACASGSVQSLQYGPAPAPIYQQVVTLTQNDSARFEARWIHLRSSARPNAFLPADRILALPIAHGEGKLVSANDIVREQLQTGGHIALTYCDASGNSGPYPINPNGSEDEIAGLCDTTGRVLGLMPHPERYVHPTQHPEWTTQPPDRADGRIVFESAIKSIS